MVAIWSGVSGSVWEKSKRRRSGATRLPFRSEEHTSELQSLMRISYAVFCLKKKNTTRTIRTLSTSKTKIKTTHANTTTTKLTLAYTHTTDTKKHIRQDTTQLI